MENIFDFGPLVVVVIPLVLGLVAAAKQAGLPSRFAAILSLALGMGFVAIAGGSWQESITKGIIVGLSASGLWSGGKAVLVKKNR